MSVETFASGPVGRRGPSRGHVVRRIVRPSESDDLLADFGSLPYRVALTAIEADRIRQSWDRGAVVTLHWFGAAPITDGVIRPASLAVCG